MKPTKKELPWSLIIDKLSDEISLRDNDKLEAWLAEEENRALFHSISAVWDSVQTEAARLQPDEERCWKIIAEKIGYEENSGEKDFLFARKQARLLPRSMHRWTLVAACGVLLVALSLFMYLLGRGPEVLPTYMAMDGKTKIVLTDSTVVWLRENSTLACVNNFKGRERKVRLKGEAFFEVKSDKKHPFIVETNGLDVKVHGTKFNVVACEKDDNITVCLEEGSVELLKPSSEGGGTYLVPGEMAEYNRETGEIAVTEGGGNMDSWVSGKLDIQNASLADIAEILSHHFNVNISVDPSIGEKYRYTFQAHDESLKDLLDILTVINPILYEYKDKNTIVISPK